LPRAWQTGAPGAGQAGTVALNVRLESQAAAQRRGAALALAAVEKPRGAHERVPGTLAAPTYYAAEQLERRPQPLVHIEPRFPHLAAAPSGRVLLRLYVGESGAVDRVEIESADAPGDFVAAAREAFAAARFLPGIKDGAAVKSVMRLEVRFGEPQAPGAAAQVSDAPREAPRDRRRRAK
jgi:TonB family protein